MLFALLMFVALILAYTAANHQAPVARQLVVPVSHVPGIHDRLEREGQEGNFAAFMFGVADPDDAGEALNVLFSLEGGRMGFDWVLLAPGNLTERERFVSLATARGYPVDPREMNGVEYLRVEEGGNLVALCLIVMKELGGLGPEDEVGLVADGFDWPPSEGVSDREH